MRARRVVSFCFHTLFLANVVAAQSYPGKPVRIIVGVPRGAGSDITTRHVVPALAITVGQQFVMDTRAGAAGNIGAKVE